MSDKVDPAYYGTVPIWILRDQRLSDGAKLFYGEISAMTNAEGYVKACYSNRQLAEFFGKGMRTITRWIDELESIGAVTTEVVAVSGNKSGHRERRIRLADAQKTGLAKIGSTANFGVTEQGVGLAKNGETPNKEENYINIPPQAPQGGRRVPTDPKWKPERFAKFWEFYRTNVRGEKRAGAVRAWDKLKPDDELLKTIAKALEAQIASEEWQRGIGKPYCASYLNGARWEDVDLDAKAKTKRKAAPPAREEDQWIT